MIVLRALQGLAGGALIPLAFSIIMTRLPPSKHPIGLTIYSVSAIFRPIDRPGDRRILVMTPSAGSRSSTSVCYPVPSCLRCCGFRSISAPRQLDELRRGDWLGIATIAIGLGALETVLEEGNKNDWFGAAWIRELSIVAAVSLVLFTIVELLRKSPLLHLRLFARRNFGLGSIANFFFGLSMYGWLYIVPLYLSRIQGYNAEQIGGVLIWIGLPQLLILPIIPKVIKIVAPKYLVIAGYILFIVGSLLATHVSGDFSGSTVPGIEPGARSRPIDGDDAVVRDGRGRDRARTRGICFRDVQHGTQLRRCDRHRGAANVSYQARAVPFRHSDLSSLASWRSGSHAARASSGLFCLSACPPLLILHSMRQPLRPRGCCVAKRRSWHSMTQSFCKAHCWDLP